MLAYSSRREVLSKLELDVGKKGPYLPSRYYCSTEAEGLGAF
jgi:hypothetical protein